MTTQSRALRAALALVLVLLAGALAACNSGKKPESELSKVHKFVDTTNAKNAAATALQTVDAKHPGVKLLYGQMIAPTTTTSTAMWQFLLGSPEDSTLYTVIVNSGRAQWQTSGSVTMAKPEWSKVPTMTAWKVDSDVALKKALAVFPNGRKSKYFASFITYLPDSATDRSIKPMQWVLSFDPSVNKGSAPTSTVLVDMATGDASFPKTDKRK